MKWCAYIYALRRSDHHPKTGPWDQPEKVAARLLREGWELRHGADHDIYKHPTRSGRIILPRHRTLSPGVARAVAKQAGWLDWTEVSMTRYVALVDGKPGSYGVTVPDLPGCTSAAATTDEVLRRATEAVRLWAEDALADGEKLPKPRSVEALRADPEVAAALAEGAALAIVPLVLDAGRPAKANLSLDAGLLAAIDEAAAARGLTRSAFLASAAREKIKSEGWIVDRRALMCP
jgi:predicted RNase H-like HicB family nuclease/predicted RNA binding protein YcfA (HicA-like mRNA interferase family)